MIAQPAPLAPKPRRSAGALLGRIVGAFLFIGIAYVGGVAFQEARELPPGETAPQAFDLLGRNLKAALLPASFAQSASYTPYEMYADVLDTLKQNYFGSPIKTTPATYAAIEGMMEQCHDPYTYFLTPKDYKSMMDDNEGEFVGIGAVLAQNAAGQVYIQQVLPNSPAMRAHLMNNDLILKVNGKPTLKMMDSDVVKLIRGQIDTKVVLTVLRNGVHHPLNISIIRQVVESPVVQFAMIDPIRKIGYISLSEFNEESDVQVGHAINTLASQGMKGLIFDLRGNPGGLLDVAREVASRFISSGPILWTRDRDESSSSLKPIDVDISQHRDQLKYPLVVLVNGDSASAAEIVSGAIKDTRSGILVGQRTFGKGVVQEIDPLPDGSAARITIEHYYTADKHDINHIGIEPNIVVKDSDAVQRQMYIYQQSHPTAIFDLKYDTQLQDAMIAERQQMQVASARPWSNPS